jgi:hypothetical protein
VIGFSKILEEVKSRAALPRLQIDLLPTANQNFFHALMLNRSGFQDCCRREEGFLGTNSTGELITSGLPVIRPQMRKTEVPKNLWDAHTECMGNLATIKIAGAISTGAQDMLCILKRSRHRGPKLDSLRSLNRPRLKIGACMDEATRGISPEGPEVSDHVHLVKISEVVTNV